MPFDGSGTYNRNFPPGGWQGDAAANIKIKSDRHDQHDNDIAAALSMMICKDGQSAPTADINMNAHKLLNLAAPANPTDAATKGYVDGIRNFPSAINITGSHPESLIKFTGATGPWGLSFTVANAGAGLFSGVNAAGTAFLWTENATPATDKTIMSASPGILQVISNVDHGTMDPILYLDQNFPGVNANGLGSIYFRGKNSAGATTTYIYFHNVIDDATAGSEDATFSIRTMTAGATTAGLTIASDRVTLSPATHISGNLTSIGSASFNTYVGSSDTTLVLHATGAGAVYLRPNGSASTSGQAYINSSGNFYADGSGTFAGNVVAVSNFISSGINVVVGQTGSGGNVYLRPNGSGSTANQVQVNENNVILNSLLNARNGASITGGCDVTGSVTAAALSAQTGTSYFLGGYSSTGGGGGGASINVWFRISAAGSSSTGLVGFYNTNGGVGSIVTNGTTTSYGTTSDAGLKNVNGEYDPQEAIAIIRADPVMAWSWISKDTTETDAVGWVAQKSYAVHPSLAMPPPEPNEEDLSLRTNRSVEPKPGEPGYMPWMLDYGKRTPYLWAALSWALDQIDQLKADVAALQGTPA